MAGYKGEQSSSYGSQDTERQSQPCCIVVFCAGRLGEYAMTKEEFGNFSQWSLKELEAKERSYTVGDTRGTELQAEIKRRRDKRNQRYSLVNVITAIVVIFSAIASGFYGLDHGIFIGSTSLVSEGLLHKSCRYLFVTGVVELPAHGGPLDTGKAYQGVQLAKDPVSLYCRFFGE